MLKSFQALGVSAPVVRALGAARHPSPVRDPGARPAGRARGPRHPRRVADRARARRSPSACRSSSAPPARAAQPCGARARPDARARDPGRRPTCGRSPQAKGLRIAAVYGGTSVGAQAKLARSAHILVATPGRLNDLLERRMVVARRRPRARPRRGRPDARHGLPAAGRPHPRARSRSNRQTMLFSATLDGAGRRARRAATPSNASRFARRAADRARAAARSSTRSSPVTADDKLDRLVEQLQRERGLALVFVRTKHGADKLVKKLARARASRAVAMHGNMSQNQRERSLARFESGRVSTLVATDVAARGLDVDDITHVINFDPPHGDDDYVHRVGRTGRAGRERHRRHVRAAGAAGATSASSRERLGHGERLDGSRDGSCETGPPGPAEPRSSQAEVVLTR